MDDTVYRRISFYKLILKNEGDDVNPLDVFSHINLLPFNEEGNYLPIGEGNMRLMHVSNSSIPLKVIIGTTRRKNLPLLEKEGIPSPLEISDNEGLYEPTHAVLFPNNVIGVEYNHYGPRATSLKSYLIKKASPIIDEVEMLPLMRSDFLDYISRIGAVKILELKVHRDMTKTFEELNRSVYHSLKGLKDTTSAEYIGITLNSNSQRGMKFNWRERLFKMFEREKVRDSTAKAFIKARDNFTDKLNDFNLLEPYIISNKQVIKNDSVHRCVDTDSMFDAIKEAYEDLKGEIEGITDMPKKNDQKRLEDFN